MIEALVGLYMFFSLLVLLLAAGLVVARCLGFTDYED